jgi:chaperonin GroES
MPVVPGDHVVFPASAGVWVDVEEERLLVCRVGQLLGVLEELEERRGSDPSTGYAGPAPLD